MVPVPVKVLEVNELTKGAVPVSGALILESVTQMKIVPGVAPEPVTSNELLASNAGRVKKSGAAVPLMLFALKFELIAPENEAVPLLPPARKVAALFMVDDQLIVTMSALAAVPARTVAAANANPSFTSLFMPHTSMPGALQL